MASADYTQHGKPSNWGRRNRKKERRELPPAASRFTIQGLSCALLLSALATAGLAPTLLAATALFLTFFLFVAITLLAALLSRSRRFGRFIRITFLFHSTFL
jgi:hypothetical protein